MRSIRTALITVALGLAAGCEVKSFINPGEVGRFRKGEPLPVPILDTLDVGIEEGDSEFLNATDPRPEDLVATTQDYVIGSNDLLVVSITDLVASGIETLRQVRVTESGRISLPYIGQVQAAGRTEAQLQQDIEEEYREQNIIQNAQVSVQIQELQSRTFSIRGGVSAPGRYQITQADFRLLDALVMARDVQDPLQKYIYVIRRTDLAGGEQGTGAEGTEEGGAEPGEQDQPQQPEDVLAPQSNAVPTGNAPDWVALLQASGQPADDAAAPAAAQETAPAATEPAADEGPAGEGRYIIIDGKPVLIEDAEAAPPDDAAMDPGLAPAADQDMAGQEAGQGQDTQVATQPGFEFNEPDYLDNTRVIRIPYQELDDGNLQYNIVVRPFDMIVVPNPPIGEYYMAGHVGRVGAYSLTGRDITLKQAVAAAGMLDGIAIPQRTDIIRRIDGNKEIFVRVDLDKIWSGQQPDIFLKPNDVVNVGTNFLAPFIAAVRNGFRVTYGFGFLYDRNYADEDVLDDDGFFGF